MVNRSCRKRAVHDKDDLLSEMKLDIPCGQPLVSWVQTTRAHAGTRAEGCGSFVCGRAHVPRYKPHKTYEPRGRVTPTVVGTSKGGSQACKGR
jgi:hypothetical protein